MTYGSSLFSKLKIFSLVISDNIKFKSLFIISLLLFSNTQFLYGDVFDIISSKLLIPIFFLLILEMSQKNTFSYLIV